MSSPTPYPVVAPTPFPTVAGCTTTQLNTEIRAPGDYVGVIFSACPTEGAFTAFTNAASRWSNVIADNLITSSFAGSAFDVRDACTFLENGFTFPATFVFDHLLIFAETVAIDGSGGILASAGPCLVDGVENFFPILGGMRFDNADLADLEAEGILQSVITHEMGHILGIGTLWQFVKQGGGQASTVSQVLLQDPVFNQNTGAVTPSNLPKFVGTSGRSEFGTLAGSSKTFIPVEDGKRADGSAFFNAAAGEGQGSIDGHWKITTFDNELMTFSIDPTEPQHPLSRMTIASLVDLGYSVSFTEADAFSLPSTTKSASLRGKGKTKAFDLSGDIMTPDFGVVDMATMRRKVAAKKLAELNPTL